MIGPKLWHIVSELDPEYAFAWRKLWKHLGRTTGDPEGLEDNPESGERWQYMGTHKEDGLLWVHQFRHRDHPKIRARVLVNIPTSKAYARKAERPRGANWRERKNYLQRVMEEAESLAEHTEDRCRECGEHETSTEGTCEYCGRCSLHCDGETFDDEDGR